MLLKFAFLFVFSAIRLGLDVIYVQAKRWRSTVGREPIQSFVGALAGKHATKGVFITTSDFHKNALDDAKGVTHKIILINGQRLAELMIEYGVGVSTVRTIAVGFVALAKKADQARGLGLF